MDGKFDFRYTLCFLTRGEDVLMLHRRNPPNLGLWNGVGGRLEPGESPHACALREIWEETGYHLEEVTFRGIMTWEGFETPPGGLYIYTAAAPPGEPGICPEGTLEWKPRAWIFSSPEVVSNILVFGPYALGSGPVQAYHFVYHAGKLYLLRSGLSPADRLWDNDSQRKSRRTRNVMVGSLSQEEVLRYSRHLLIPEVGMEGQRKLKSASVLLVGSGGLGSPLALYLAAAGVGHIGIVDYDVVDDSNLQRQVIHDSSRVGTSKVESAKQRMVSLNSFIQVDAYNEVFSAANARRIAEGYDILVDGTDNFPTRYLMNDLCVLTCRPYIYGSIFRFEGQVSVFDARHGPCYRCLFPDPPPPGSVPGCAEGGVFGVLPGTIGTLQGTEVIKVILGIGEPLIGRLLLYDALDMTFQMVQLRKNPNCKVCGPHPQVTDLIDYELFCGVPARGTHVEQGIPEVDPQTLAERQRQKAGPRLLDVREEVERQISELPGSLHIPIGQLPVRLAEVDPGVEWVVYCRTGVRSAQAVRILLDAGYSRVFSLRGGINAWAREVDPKILLY